MTTDPLISLDALQACVDAAEGHADEALQRLAGRDDPESILARLTILLDLKRNTEAMALIRGRSLDPKWCIKAVVATSRTGALADVRAQIESVDSAFAHDGLLRLRCRLAAGEAAIHRACDSMMGQPIFAEDLTPEQLSWIDAGAEFLAPVVNRVSSFGVIEHAVEQHALETALFLAFLRADRETAARIGPVLERVYPLPFPYVDAVLRRQCPVTDDLLPRLRNEHADSWDAIVASIRIEGYILQHPERAAISALSMIRSAPPEYQSELANVLFDLSAALPRETAADVDHLIVEVLPADSPVPLAVRVRQALLEKNIDEAERLVTQMPDKDDPIALQFRAQIQLERGQKHDARLAIERACARFRTPGLLELAANLAVEEEDWNAAAGGFQRILRILPADARVRNNRAYALIHAQRFTEAAEEFQELAHLEPKNPRHRFNRAATLAQGGRLEESLTDFQDYCVAAGFPPDGVMSQCEILISLDRAAEAFSLANKYIDRYWDERQFVAGYMSCAYAAGEDHEAHKAMMRLQELEQTVEPGRRILRAVVLDELKEHFTHFRKSEDMLHEQLLRGQIPWLFADKLLNRVPYSAWSLRTQPLKWESDDHLGAARFTIYATNGFQATDTDGNKELRELLCSDANLPVCIDMSSLLTLNELGLLTLAADYFGKILVPAQCGESTLDHLRRLVPHQPSRRDAAIAIRSAIEAGKIAVRDSASVGTDKSRLSETDDSDKHAYRFIDLAPALRDAGVIGTTEYSSLENVAHAPSSVDADHPPLVGGQQLLCDASTLEILAQQGLLGVCVETFDISLSPDDRREVFGAIQAFDAQAQIHERASRLYRMLRNDSRFVIDHVALPPEFAEGSLFDDPLAESTFVAAFGSIEKNLPLFTDDRALQMYVCHRRPGAAASAFATPAFLEALATKDNADMATLAPALLSVMNWRYRFVVPSAKFLKYYADQFPQHIPGRYLRQVASYAHQSMNDPGLFCGFEPTNPPTTIGTRLYFLWIKAFMDFAASCWLDETCSPERAAAIMRWILTEAIPPVPRLLNPHAQGVIATQAKLSLLNYLALATATTPRSERVAGAMKSFRDSLELSDAEYFHLVTQIAHE